MDKEQLELEARNLLFKAISEDPPLLVIVKEVNFIEEDKGKYKIHSCLTILTEDDAVIGDAGLDFTLSTDPSLLRRHINSIVTCVSQMEDLRPRLRPRRGRNRKR